MKYIIMLLMLIFINGCFAGGKTDTDYEKIVDKVIDAYVSKSVKEDGFRLSSFGGGLMGDIQKINLGFDVMAELDIDQTRILIVKKEEEFLSMLNVNREVRPYLHEYPFPANRFELKMGFRKKDGSYVDTPNIAYVSILSGVIYYRIYDKAKKEYKRIYSEPYEEGYKIVYGENAPNVGK
jgi:hypothetical protein